MDAGRALWFAVLLVVSMMCLRVALPRLRLHFLKRFRTRLDHVPWAPTTCNASGPEVLDDRFFRPTPARDGTADLFLGRNLWLLGNSVTRHYGFAFAEALAGAVGNRLIQRKEEKAMCRSANGVDSCTLVACGAQGVASIINFAWKDLLSLENFHDDTRDICVHLQKHRGKTYNNTEQCLVDHFTGALPTDVLIVGSVPINRSRLRADMFSDFPHSLFPSWARGAYNANMPGILAMLARVFPGPIIWHSSTFIKLQNQSQQDTANQFVSVVNAVVGCAVRRHPRFIAVDLWDLQQTHLDLYADFIHHPGFISQRAVRRMLFALQMYPNVTGRACHKEGSLIQVT